MLVFDTSEKTIVYYKQNRKTNMKFTSFTNPSSESKDSSMFFMQLLKATRTALSGSSIRFNKDPTRVFTLDSSVLKSRCLQRWGIFSINAGWHGWRRKGKHIFNIFSKSTKVPKRVMQTNHKAYFTFFSQKNKYCEIREDSQNSALIKYYSFRYSHRPNLSQGSLKRIITDKYRQ